MMRVTGAIIVLCGLCAMAVSAEERPSQMSRQLPPPLENIAFDLGPLENDFHIVKADYYPAGDFRAGDRIVAEETLVWTLQAKEAMKGEAVRKLMRPRPRSGGVFREVYFLKKTSGKDVPADAQDQGYRLIDDGRWISPKRAPDLNAGDEARVWVHLGKQGSAGLIRSKATHMAVTQE